MCRIMGWSNPSMGTGPLSPIILPSPLSARGRIHQLSPDLVIATQLYLSFNERQESNHPRCCCIPRTEIRQMDDQEGCQEWDIRRSSSGRIDVAGNMHSIMLGALRISHYNTSYDAVYKTMFDQSNPIPPRA